MVCKMYIRSCQINEGRFEENVVWVVGGWCDKPMVNREECELGVVAGNVAKGQAPMNSTSTILARRWRNTSPSPPAKKMTV